MLEDGGMNELEVLGEAILSNPDDYRKLEAKPVLEKELIIYDNERSPKGELFSRIDHIMVRHGDQLMEAFNTENEDEVFGGIIEAVRNKTDSYREAKTGNVTCFYKPLNLIVIVADRASIGSNPPPPPPFVKTAFTIDGGEDTYKRRKSNRAIQ